VAALVDTNILVYRFDPRDAGKQARARDVLRDGLAAGSLRVPHQALTEFVAAVTRPDRDGPLLPPTEAWHELENLLAIFPILYPTGDVLRAAVRGASLHRLSWFDAHLWAYADSYGLDEILSEDFQHGRLYGSVRAINPFVRDSRR
jgi:predicted nucleic acid-binding protein